MPCTTTPTCPLTTPPCAPNLSSLSLPFNLLTTSIFFHIYSCHLHLHVQSTSSSSSPRSYFCSNKPSSISFSPKLVHFSTPLILFNPSPVNYFITIINSPLFTVSSKNSPICSSSSASNSFIFLVRVAASHLFVRPPLQHLTSCKSFLVRCLLLLVAERFGQAPSSPLGSVSTPTKHQLIFGSAKHTSGW